MDLLQDIRSDRARQKRKQPYIRSLFNTVCSLVKAYGLREDFLRSLDNLDNWLPEKNMTVTRLKAKDAVEFSLFSLASREEYDVAVAIMSKIDNPYLQFAHTPEEILLAGPLYEANPLLKSEDLVRCHFETLLLYERGKIDLKDLTQQLTSAARKSGPEGQGQRPKKKRSRLDSLQQRIQELGAFIAAVENKKSKSG